MRFRKRLQEARISYAHQPENAAKPFLINDLICVSEEKDIKALVSKTYA
jgi:hypothetical protein